MLHGLGKGLRLKVPRLFPAAQLRHPGELKDTCSAPFMSKGVDVLFQGYFRNMEKIPTAS